MLPLQPSSHNSNKSRGFTLMILGGAGREPRRLYVPHWLCAVLLMAWLGVMAIAAWFGFQSAAATVEVSPRASEPRTGASANTAAVAGK
jgi:hypothetical protein